jgi:hypothetical protein
MQVETTKQAKLRAFWALVRSAHGRRTEVRMTILRIIHGPDNSHERNRHRSIAAAGSNAASMTRTRRPIMDPSSGPQPTLM